MIQNEPIRRKM